MRFSYQNIISFLKDKPSKEALSEKLFQLGHEHDLIGDIYDIDFTPNRGDCLSLLGITRDLNIFFDNQFSLDKYDEHIEDLGIDFINKSIVECPKISFLEIGINGKISEYKPYLEEYFLTTETKKNNFFTDISNYLSYELGQPTHCFDSDKIKGEIIFENKQCLDSFKTLLGTEIELKDKNCVFSMNGEIISLAGVMGGISTACNSKTKKALIECAYFTPEAIIGKSVKYNIQSDAAHKFERGVDISLQEETLRRFISIVMDHCSVNSIRFRCFDEKNNDFSKNLEIDLEKINKILGTAISMDEYILYLKKLGFKVDKKIKIPPYRNDIDSQNDLAEEIARIIGYNNLPRSPIKLNSTNEKKVDKETLLKDFLVQKGFSEVINFPFSEKKSRESIILDNPLDSKRGFMRTYLKDSLKENLLYNERRQKDSIKLFEISDVYFDSDELKSSKRIGIIASGRCGHNHIDFSKNIDRKHLDKLLNNDLGLQVDEIPRSELDTKRKEKIFYIESDFSEISEDFFNSRAELNKSFNFIKYKKISEFPSSTRDFSFSIKDLKKVDEVIDYLEQTEDKFLKKSYMFDFFKNTKSNEIKIGYRFIFQANDRTLSEEDINKSIENILLPLLSKEGVEIPGI